MRTLLIVVGLLLVVAGAVWVAQGLDLAFAPRSFMTRNLTWTGIGLVTVLVGVVLAAWAWRRRPS